MNPINHPYSMTWLVSTVLWIIIYYNTKFLKEDSIECKIYRYFWNEELSDVYNKTHFLIKLYIAFYLNIAKFFLYLPYYTIRSICKILDGKFDEWDGEYYKIALGIYSYLGFYGFYLWHFVLSDPNLNIDNCSVRFVTISALSIFCSIVMIAFIAISMVYILIKLTYNKIINNKSTILIIKEQ